MMSKRKQAADAPTNDSCVTTSLDNKVARLALSQPTSLIGVSYSENSLGLVRRQIHPQQGLEELFTAEKVETLKTCTASQLYMTRGIE